ncbi:uncharacterized protein LOC133488913 [Phyllopteryx taeniolatus]|uniref:uncharacterized protein LOC133488913 n=1 Tax=Phyllopteryx taeniolatus TaxID=161469 RepID=UPI002AD2F7F2|nr:uncharacterized protein LOC133488913 [Phyllopteryx taeniolatus]
MPFGLTNAPAVFQALVNDVLRDMIRKFVFMYLDEILVFSRYVADHKDMFDKYFRDSLRTSSLLKQNNRQFIVEVDASEAGVVAVLSQQSQTDGKVHPCAYFSPKLSQAEKNYGIGDRKLLALKMPLEECRHFLEGAEHLFIVWTDNKNLEYIRSAQRLSSRPARLTGNVSGPINNWRRRTVAYPSLVPLYGARTLPQLPTSTVTISRACSPFSAGPHTPVLQGLEAGPRCPSPVLWHASGTSQPSPHPRARLHGWSESVAQYEASITQG